MRKALTLILTAVLLLGLCACGPSQDSVDRLEESLLAAQQSLNDYAALAAGRREEVSHVRTAEDFQWNGKTAVWFLLPRDASPDDIVAADAMGAMCQANGWTYEKRELGSGSATPLGLLKQAVADGNVGALVYTELSGYMAEFAQAAADAGIILLCLDPDCPEAVAGSIQADYSALGRETCALLDAWAAQRGLEAGPGGKIPVAINAYGETNPDAPWTSALRDALEESEIFYKSRTGLVCNTDDYFSGAYLWARRVMSEKPEMRVFCCYTPQAAYGVCYYLEQYCADQELDLADFCVVWQGRDGDSGTYLSVAGENASYTAARGYVVSEDGPWTTGARLGHQILGIAYGEELPAGLEETYALPAENGVPAPDSFGGWQWGLNASEGITAYASFAEGEDYVLFRRDMPLADILAASQPDKTAEMSETEAPDGDEQGPEA